MKTKKIVFLIVFSAFLLFGVTSNLIYYVARESEKSEFSSAFFRTQSVAYREIETYFSNREKNKKKSAIDFDYICFDLKNLYGFQPSINSVFIGAFLDEDGNILSTTKNSVRIKRFDENYKEKEAFVVDLETYLNQENRDSIKVFLKENHHFGVFVSEISLFKQKDKYIPVDVTFNSTLQTEETFEEKELKLKLTDYKPNVFISDREYDSIETLLIDFDSEIKEDCYKSLLSDLEEYSANIKNDEYSTADYVFRTRNIEQRSSFDSTEFEGKIYYVYMGMAHDIVNDTLENNSFVNGIIYLGIFFSLSGAVITIASLLLRKKSKNLSNAENAFVAAAAHELKTPLAVIQNQSECIIENIAAEKNDEYILSIHEEAIRMNGLVTNLLRYSRLLAAGSIKKEKTNLQELIFEEIRKHEAFAQANEVKIKARLTTEKANIKCNKELLSLAIGNYISNAIKFSMGKKEVKVSLRKMNNSFYLEVYNEGENISREKKDVIWNLMAKGDESRGEKEGSGMGLSLSAKIFEYHDYEYGFRNVSDGVVFYLFIS